MVGRLWALEWAKRNETRAGRCCAQRAVGPVGLLLLLARSIAIVKLGLRFIE